MGGYFTKPKTRMFCIAGILAIGLINEAIDKGDEAETLKALQLPMGRLYGVDDKQCYHYQVSLANEKDRKAEVTQYLIITVAW